jgi:DNA-binding CsgD family transcriptional regulator
MLATNSAIVSDFVRGIQSAHSLDEAIDVLHEATSRIGYRRLVYAKGRLAHERETLAPRPNLIARNFPSDWEEDYEKRARFDPYFRVSCLSMTGTEWSHIEADAKGYSEPVREFIEWTHRLGLRDGFIVPIRLSSSHYAAVSAIDRRDDLDDSRAAERREILALTATFFMGHVNGRFENERPEPITLSKRETECLFWSAQGKATEDIATILAISPETVRIYFKRVASKLDATNRTNAVAKAMRLGLVEPSLSNSLS